MMLPSNSAMRAHCISTSSTSSAFCMTRQPYICSASARTCACASPRNGSCRCSVAVAARQAKKSGSLNMLRRPSRELGKASWRLLRSHQALVYLGWMPAPPLGLDASPKLLAPAAREHPCSLQHHVQLHVRQMLPSSIVSSKCSLQHCAPFQHHVSASGLRPAVGLCAPMNGCTHIFCAPHIPTSQTHATRTADSKLHANPVLPLPLRPTTACIWHTGKAATTLRLARAPGAHAPQ